MTPTQPGFTFPHVQKQSFNPPTLKDKTHFVKNEKLGSHICQISKVNINPISSLGLKKNLQRKLLYNFMLYATATVLDMFTSVEYKSISLPHEYFKHLVHGEKRIDTTL